MIKRFPLVALIVFLLGTSALRAQDRSFMTNLNQAVRAQWIQVNIVGGRVIMECARYGGIESGPNSTTRKDHISIRGENAETAMTYELLNAKEQYTINGGDDGHLDIRFVPKNKPQEPTVEFSQKPLERVVLTLETGGKKQEYTADNLWQMLILYPEISRKHLVPLIQPLQANGKLSEMADSIEKQLLNSASHTAAYDRTSWKRWIVQLGDDNYARRQAADRALRAANPAFLVYLQQIDLNRLDAEQQFRLQRIRDSLAEKINNDSPEHVANWLSGDPGIWLALLSRSDVAARRIAAKQLTAILEGPIPVDPEAEPATQKDHFERLRSKIESLKKQD